MIAIAQDWNIDSLLKNRVTDTLNRKVKTYYSPDNKKIATDIQSLITGAFQHYETKYKVQFQIKVILLDSSKWFKETVPFGFVFFDGTNQLVLNNLMKLEKFKSTYELNSISKQINGL